MDNIFDQRRLRKYRTRLNVLIPIQLLFYVLILIKLTPEVSHWYLFGLLNVAISGCGLYAIRSSSIQLMKMYLTAILLFQLGPLFHVKFAACRSAWWEQNIELKLYCSADLIVVTVSAIIFYCGIGYLNYWY